MSLRVCFMSLLGSLFSLSLSAAPIIVPTGVMVDANMAFNESDSFLFDIEQTDSISIGSSLTEINNGLVSNALTAPESLLANDLVLQSVVRTNNMFIDFENLIYDFSLDFTNTLSSSVTVTLGLSYQQMTFFTAEDATFDFASVELFNGLSDELGNELFVDLFPFSASKDTDFNSLDVDNNEAGVNTFDVTVDANSAFSYSGFFELLFFSDEFATIDNDFQVSLFVDQITVNNEMSAPVNAPQSFAMLIGLVAFFVRSKKSKMAGRA